MHGFPTLRSRARCCWLLADQLVRVPGRPGLNVLLWALAGTAVLWLLPRRRETPVSRQTWLLVGGAVAFAGLLVLRDADALAAYCIFSADVLLGLAAGRGALAWARRAHIAYGLTEQRLYVSVFMIWLTGVLAWLAATVLRGRRRGFTFAATAGGLACVAALHVLNPHALIARVNISRAASGAEIDAAYLRELSADAVPTLLARLPSLPDSERCRVAAMLEERWSGERRGGWRTWNLSDARARRLMAEFSAPADCPAAADKLTVNS